MSLERIHITPQLVQTVRDAVDLLEVASDFTRLRKQGQRYLGLCPFHKEKTPSFSIDASRGLYYCFGCGVGGDAIKLAMQMTGDDFPTTIEALARRYGIPLPAPTSRRGRRPELDVEGAVNAAAAFFVDRLRSAPDASGYLERRRIPSELIERFGLGYAPEAWRDLIGALESRIPMAALEAAGLVGRSERSDRPFDRFRNRLMFPIHLASGRVVGFGGRTLGEDSAKYLNSRDSEHFQKGQILYGLHHARRSIRETGRVLLVEGYFDVLAAVASGVEWTVASMGTALTKEQARLLARYADEVILGYDGDRAGEEACRKALPLLLSEGLAIRRARFPAGQDPDSLRLDEGTEAVVATIESAADAVVLEIEKLPVSRHHDPRRQSQAAAAVRELLQPIRDPVLRHGYTRLAADRLGVPQELLSAKAGVVARADRRAREGAEPKTANPNEKLERQPRQVRSLEERVLQLLLQGSGGQEALDLPPPDVFLDDDCRAIYTSYRDLCDSGSSPREPEAAVREVMSGLPTSSGAIDRLAQVLLQGSSHSRDGELRDSLRRLERRWKQQRSRELARDLEEAQRQGDQGRLERLLRQKADVSRDLHGTVDREEG